VNATAEAKTWASAEKVGKLDSQLLTEASGIAASRLVSDRLYHINDSGSSPYFVLTNTVGANARKVHLNVAAFFDTEDLATGVCPDAKGSCLYIADIGDNKERRQNLTTFVVREQDPMPDEVTPAFQFQLEYPDGQSRNAEGFAIHPDGFGYVLTKESPSAFYRFSLKKVLTDRSVILRQVGELSLHPWMEGTDKPRKMLPTSLDIRPDGKEIVVITRSSGVALPLDLEELVAAGEYDWNDALRSRSLAGQILPILQLPQTEAIAYSADGSELYYTSELGDGEQSYAPLMRIRGERLDFTLR
jgi:hypothetical protein